MREVNALNITHYLSTGYEFRMQSSRGLSLKHSVVARHSELRLRGFASKIRSFVER
jgi:hypothetical protein